MQTAFVKNYLSILLLSSICFISVFSAIWIRIDPDSAEAVKARDRIAKELIRRVVATEFAFKRLDPAPYTTEYRIRFTGSMPIPGILETCQGDLICYPSGHKVVHNAGCS
ncbi:uncharacterized protein LOC132754021 [Ruditapes philippinarum]|uniref:uncharacterized protein LOC132754021 n=1 Tax=Ruditapes philippinarum TaxID=129788 RepID=UPI00295A8634|nr:uncharacterized protein LOC132754021 [Ruditapes philippinarum]